MAARTIFRLLCALSLALVIAARAAHADTPAADPADSAAGIQFFEQKIRPVLAANCYECHSGATPKGKLSIDTRDGIRRGGETGPAVVPGRAKESLMIQAVRHDGLEMPPDKPRLPLDVVADLEKWVTMGAPDPRDGKAVEKPATAMTLEQAKSHWSFQPIKRPPLPIVKNTVWPHNDIDRFMLAKLEDAGLEPSPSADPHTLVRRAYFDVVGLPPPFDVMEKFDADPRPAAFAQIVDELLARPEYGQRWARHWLDVARYADTTEQSVDGERRIPFAHTYRDYVIDAFNSDKPFNRFIVEQIAADRLPADQKPDLRALGFLTVGRRFLGNVEAPALVIDDRIDVTSRGLLGLTVSCARCHDHKFDAIPTADYYSLFGIMAGAEEPMDLPETAVAAENEAIKKYRAERAEIFKKYEAQIDHCVEKSNRMLREMATEYLRYAVETSHNHRTTEGFAPLDTPRGLLLLGGTKRWQALLAKCGERGEPFFKLWHQLIALPREGFAEKAKPVLADAQAHSGDHHPLVVAAFKGKSPASMLEVADLYGQTMSEAFKSIAPESKAVVELITGPDSPIPVNRDEIRDDFTHFATEFQLVLRPDGEVAGQLREKLTSLEAGAPLERAMAVHSATMPVDPHVHIRGDARQLGAAVPRRFLRALANVDDRKYADDGRLELAEAVASAKNPLTARVIVNRVWQHHFGQGLVATPDNFGAMGDRPSHPELLDHLASWFMEHGWSLKALHRYILASAAWQQNGAANPVAAEKDPLDRLLWRMTPRRLEFEPMRDSLLAVAGRLDTHLGGRSAPLDDGSVRRAIYGYTDRFRIPALLRNFDAANPDISTSRRPETINPLQALYFMNSPFLRAQADAVLHQPDITSTTTAADRIVAIYRRILSRNPDADETALAKNYVGPAPLDDAGTRQWTNFVQSLLLSNEFVFID
jgi:cytochrome c553